MLGRSLRILQAMTNVAACAGWLDTALVTMTLVQRLMQVTGWFVHCNRCKLGTLMINVIIGVSYLPCCRPSCSGKCGLRMENTVLRMNAPLVTMMQSLKQGLPCKLSDTMHALLVTMTPDPLNRFSCRSRPSLYTEQRVYALRRHKMSQYGNHAWKEEQTELIA